LRSDIEIEGISDFIGKRIVVGAEGSGTRTVVLVLLGAHGINSQNTDFVDVATDELDGAFASNEIDGAFLIGAPESEHIAGLIRQQNVKLHGLERADAYVRRYPVLSKVSLPQGVLDLQLNRPAKDVTTVALTAMLAANKDLHPALVDLLLVAASEIHGGHSLLADAGQFPTPRYTDLPLSEEAERHFKYGPPFLLRYLPFWAATLVDRLWVMLLPLLGLAIPLIKILPPAYRWQIRRRLLRLYVELDRVDPLNNALSDDEDVAVRLERLERLDNDSVIQSVPRGYTDDVYKLRRDIDLVRRRLNATPLRR